jgi:hypothetical protein
MRYHVIKDGKVINSIVYNGTDEFVPPEGSILVQHDNAGIGDKYENEKFLRKKIVEVESVVDGETIKTQEEVWEEV